MDSEGRSRKLVPVTCYRGDTITWDAGEKHCTLWFPNAAIFGDVHLDIDGGTGSLTVLMTAPLGTHEYCVYRHDPAEFLEANSHPVMILREGP